MNRQRPIKSTRSYWGLALGACIVLLILVFVITVLATTSSSPAQPIFACSTGEQDAELSCNVGAAFNIVPIPFVQSYREAEDAELTTTALASRLAFRGISLAGLEFENGEQQLGAKGSFGPFATDALLFVYKGMNTFRIPITWEYFADINGNINALPTYLERLDGVIATLTAKNATIIIDLHNYMRYNPSNVALNVRNTNPNGPDVIGQGSAAPTREAYALLWTNIVNRYHSVSILYALMNEPHDVTFGLMTDNYNAGIQAIREREAALSITPPHLILICGNNYSGLHSWFGTDTFSNSNDALFYDKLIDPQNQFAIEVHQYFDQDSSGTYNTSECVPNGVFNATFDAYWAKFVNWSTENEASVLLGEFGAPTTETCIEDVKHLLTAFTEFRNVIGWVVWSSGNSWGNYILSVAPGGPVNNQMWNSVLYENYLTAINETLPPLSSVPKAIRITNQSPGTLYFEGGSLPFQFQGNASLAPGGIGYLYSNNQFTTPRGDLQIKYYKTLGGPLIGFGITAPDSLGKSYAYTFKNNGEVVREPASQCNIIANGTAANTGESRCYIVK